MPFCGREKEAVNRPLLLVSGFRFENPRSFLWQAPGVRENRLADQRLVGLQEEGVWEISGLALRFDEQCVKRI